MEWTRKQRYTKIEEVTEKELHELTIKVENCPWRQEFHVQPETGLLNDPNGFSFYNGEYHLFYQWFPLGPVHGLKYWYHTKSKDLVHWENVGIAIKPDNKFDSHGAYSGSAIEHEEKLYLMYTGNTRLDDWQRHPYQCMAVMDQNGGILKIDKPVIADVPKGYTDHFRDPSIWEDEGIYYALIGAQRQNETGCVLLYRSFNIIDWYFEGEVKTGLNDFGYMWECPNYFEKDNQGVLIFSPQGIEPYGDKYQNIFQSGYVIGDLLDLKEKSFSHGEFYELDRGFDFYAPQTMEDPEGRRILVGWMGLPEINYPTDQNGWAHCLTLPRELTIQNGKLIQQPIKELQTLRKQKFSVEDSLVNEKKMYNDMKGRTYELICEVDMEDALEFGIEFRANEQDKTVVKYDARSKKIVLDRTLSGEIFGSTYGTMRKCELDSKKIKFHLFVDKSSVEIFINDGEAVFTARIFPNQSANYIRFYSKGGSVSFNAEKWDI
ncbi:glycoside hydrolase family 32 protein [Bacillus sp. FSL K6-3431]|uniref:glycoside hydrolase family 32 protein n=1 Tax=Bacillus sp. FSL K6-3431 TaxID=2921500 RepID=UPI0030FC5AF1